LPVAAIRFEFRGFEVRFRWWFRFENGSAAASGQKLPLFSNAQQRSAGTILRRPTHKPQQPQHIQALHSPPRAAMNQDEQQHDPQSDQQQNQEEGSQEQPQDGSESADNAQAEPADASAQGHEGGQAASSSGDAAQQGEGPRLPLPLTRHDIHQALNMLKAANLASVTPFALRPAILETLRQHLAQQQAQGADAARLLGLGEHREGEGLDVSDLFLRWLV
jgi:hypothetical protein